MNEDIEKIMKIQNKLNTQRFHLCIRTDLSEKCEWLLFQNIPNIDDYLSSSNMPILTSYKTSVDELEDYLRKYEGFDRW